MKKAEVKLLRNNKWQIEDKLVLKERKKYILKDKELRLDVIQLHYDSKIQRTIKWSILENKKQNKDASEKIKTEYNTRKTIAIYISKLYYKVTSIKRPQFNSDSM